MDSYYKNLKVWQFSITLVSDLYELLKDFPKNETYWIVDQMKRSAVSVPSNIAEWSWRKNKKEFKQYLYISKWSLNELDTQLIISKNLWFITDEKLFLIQQRITEILKMLSSLIKSLEN